MLNCDWECEHDTVTECEHDTVTECEHEEAMLSQLSVLKVRTNHALPLWVHTRFLFLLSSP